MAANSLLATAKTIVAALRLDMAPPLLPLDTEWGQLLHHADGHSLTPLLYTVWRDTGQFEQIPAEFQARLAKSYEDNTQRNHHIRAELVEVHRLLDDADVPHLVLKGWPLVEQLYTDPAQRVLYDHDFLVPAAQAQAGYQALRDAGFVPLPGKDEWIEKHLTPIWRNNGYQWDGYLFDPHYPRPVELHLLLWEDGWRGLQVKPLPAPWTDTRYCAVAGVDMQLLSLENTLVHLAMHFAGHLVEREARLNQLLDLARFVQQQAEGLDWVQCIAQTEQANVGRFVYASLWLAHQVFGAPLPPPAVWPQFVAAVPAAFAGWLTTSAVEDVLTSDYRRLEKGKDYQLTFLAAGSIAERLGTVRFALLPPQGQLIKKYKIRHRQLTPLYYPYYIIERLITYGRGML